MIGIIDYGMGNLGSVENACRFLKLDARIVKRPDEFTSCASMILPGVGAFGDCMAHLQAHGFVPAIRAWVDAGKPFLGICLGLQALFQSSEESQGVRGLGIFEGTVRRFQLGPEYKVPQIGWNRMAQKQPACPLFKDVPDASYFYLVHSYYVDPVDREIVAGVTDYGVEYTTVVWKNNVMATQFHPEKSHEVGLRMLRNFGGVP